MARRDGFGGVLPGPVAAVVVCSCAVGLLLTGMRRRSHETRIAQLRAMLERLREQAAAKDVQLARLEHDVAMLRDMQASLYADVMQYPPLARATRRRLTLPPTGNLPPLDLDIFVATAPPRHFDPSARAIVVYVLDPAPSLFGLVASTIFAQAAYSGNLAATRSPEAAYRRMHCVGVGFASESYKLSAAGMDNGILRDMRRRHFPPFVHPSHGEGRQRNAYAARLAQSLGSFVVPLVEGESLGISSSAGQRPRRCLLGASYSAVLALQVLLAAENAFDDFILGSPSIPFDPELLDDVRSAAKFTADVGTIVISGAKERWGR